MADLSTLSQGRSLATQTCHGPVDEDTGAQLFQTDFGVSERAVLKLLQVPLDDGQFSALISFTFNLGAGALQRSTLRRKINNEEHRDVLTEMWR